MSNQPMLLYHGSSFSQNELMPGFMRSHEEVFWDETESNHYLYASSDKEEAISLGFASAIEKQFLLDRYSCEGNKLTLSFARSSKIVTLRALSQVQVHLYTIELDKSEGWVKNNNAYNNTNTEYKTKDIVKKILKTEVINIKSWLSSKEVEIITTTPAFLNWI